MRDELTFSASDNDDAPDGPILLSIECDTMTKTMNLLMDTITLTVLKTSGDGLK